ASASSASGAAGGASGAAGADALTVYYNQRCQQKHGPHSQYDSEEAACVCDDGFGPDDSEQCVPDEEEMMGANAAAAADGRPQQAASSMQASGTGQPSSANGAAASKTPPGGAAGGKNSAWFSQFFGKGTKGGGAVGGAEEDTCPGGVCENPPAKYRPPPGAGSSAGASASSGPAIIHVDKLCKHALGRGAEFDGVDSCRCSAGYTHKGGQCTADPDNSAQAAASAPTAAKGGSRGGGGSGGIKKQDAAYERYTQMCRSEYGAHAEFDGVDSCRCKDGYEEVGGTCAKTKSAAGASVAGAGMGAGGGGAQTAAQKKAAEKAKYDRMCQQQWPNSMYDGVSECVCQEGFVEVEEQGCVPAGRAGGRGGSGSGGAAAVGAGGAAGADANQNRHHLACQQHFGPHAQFDGVDSCECKDGFSQGADGLCVPDAPAKAGAAGTRGGGGAGGAGRAQFAEFDAQCAQLVANSEFDGVSDCRCKQGFNQVDALPCLISPTWD
ncbi:MAG: hypothetical protein ACPIOQ_35050, partial [Promethearchaeia archaeon]